MKKNVLLIVTLVICSLNSKAANTLPITGILSPTIPTDWVYVSNDPANYPNPSFYTTAGALGLKLNYEKMGIISPEFAPTNKVTVTLNIIALNQNTKTGTNENFFTIYGLGSQNDTVATNTLKSVVKGNNTIDLSGNNIVKVKIIMTGYPFDGTKYCNVNLASVAISETTSGINPVSEGILYITLVGKKLTVPNATNSKAEIFNMLGAKVQDIELTNGSAELNLNKGLYIVRVGNKSAKISL